METDSKSTNMRWQGPVRTLHEHLVVFVPLNEGGKQLISLTRGLSDVEGDALKIVLPTWLAEELTIKAGSTVVIDNVNGQFNITLAGKI